MRIYFLAKAGKWMNSMTDEFINYGSSMEWLSCSLEQDNYKIFEEKYDETNPLNRHYILNEMIASKGFRSFAEVRDTIKVLSTDLGDGSVLMNTATGDAELLEGEETKTGFTNTQFAWDPATRELIVTPAAEYTPTKVTVAMDQQRKDATVLAMKAVAKAVIEEEFDKRLSKLDLNNKLEEVTFVYQWEEAKAWEADNTVETPILSALATARDLTVEEMVAKINTARVGHKTKVTKLLQKMSEVKQAYKKQTTIPDMNRFYEDYFNIQMPFQQAVAEGRLILNDDGTETRTVQPKSGFNF